MRFRIHFTWLSGAEDYIDIEADTIEEIRRIAKQEVDSRKGENPWSEQLE